MVVCWNVCYVAAVVKNSVFSLGVLKYVVCLCSGCDGFVFSVCIVRRGAVGTCVWEVWVFRHADVVCLCAFTIGCVSMVSALLCILRSYILQVLAWTECKLFCLVLVWDCFVLTRHKLYVVMVVYISWLHSCLCVCVNVMVMSSAYTMTWTGALWGGKSVV